MTTRRCGQLIIDGTEQCPRDARFRFAWPGKDEGFICNEHVQLLRNLANAMGSTIQVIPLDDEPAETYPRGQLNADDEGELQVVITMRDRTVIVDFGKPIVWLGMPGSMAIEIGEKLIERGREAMEPEKDP